MKRIKLFQKKFKDLKIYKIRIIQVIASTALFLIILSSNTRAQNNSYINSNAVQAEKVYLQLDGKVYTTGNIIWFKSIVLSAYNHVPSSLSGVLYVELIRPDKSIIHEKKLIKLEDGIGYGFFYLDKTLQEGLYLIRAYTKWNMNFETDFFYKEYIHVFAHRNELDKDPISNITLINDKTNEKRLKACFNPFVIDSLHKNKLKVIFTLDNKKDTLFVKRGKDNKYWIDRTIKNDSQFATLQMQTTNQQSYSSTIVLNQDYYDLQFLPESGELVHGLPCRVGFKALDANGQGILVQGDIVDEKDSVITSFKSNSLGMGSFVLNKTDSTKTYFARLISESDENKVLLYPLPDIASIGNILTVEKQGNKISIVATSNYMKNDSIYLHLSFRGIILYELKVRLNEGIFRLSISKYRLPKGIISCSMIDNSMQPVAERLFFNERTNSRINIALSTDKQTYYKRELTNLNIETSNSSGEPIKANLSVLVINKQQLGKLQHSRQNILSWFLLDSELKGEIERPGFYFNKDSIMQSHLDALMLTQGWRKYNYSKSYKELSIRAEPTLSVSGQVSSLFSMKKKKEAELTMVTFGKNKSIYNQVSDSLGKFKFNLIGEYGKDIKVLIQSSKKSGKKKNYTITLDKNESPPITFNHIRAVKKLDSVVNNFVEKNIERRKIDDAFPLQSGNILLDEVEVTGYRLTPKRKMVMEKYGKPDLVIEGKAILEKEKKWSYGLYSILQFKFPNKLWIIEEEDISPDAESSTYAKLEVYGSDITLVVIDGIPVPDFEYPLIPNIPPSEVSSFEIIECAKNIHKLYSEAYGENLTESVQCGSVVAIYTHGGKGIYGTDKPKGILMASVPVFSPPREFYAPKYESPRTNNWNKPDLRALIHWEPILKTDSLGIATTSFYNADNLGKIMVVVEVISDKGEIGYQEIEYNIDE